MLTESDIMKAVVPLDVSMPMCFYYQLQCAFINKPDEWYTWMPDDKIKKFVFEIDAITEAQECIENNVPNSNCFWRVIFVATISEAIRRVN